MRTYGMGALAASVCMVALAVPAQAQAQEQAYNIPAGSLRSALDSFGRQSGKPIIYKVDEVRGLRSRGFRGTATPQAALDAILAGTTFTARIDGSGAVAIVKSGNAPVVAEASTSLGEGGAIDYTLDEIIVTAQKHAERLQDVPVPVTAIGAEALVRTNALRLQDYYTRIPGVNVNSNFMGAPRVTIRGLTTSGGTNPTVGIAVDDIPFGSATLLGGGYQVPNLDPSELARMEVLRGPQGTLYGANSLAGLINYITVDPATDGFGGRIAGGFSGVRNGSEVGYSLRGALNVPIGDSMALRASAFRRLAPGYIDNIRTNERAINSTGISGGRLSILARLGENVTLRLGALFQDRMEKGSSFVDGLALLDDLQQTALADTGDFTGKIEAYSARVTAQLGNAELTSLTGFSINRAHGSFDYTYALGSFAQTTFSVGGARYLFQNRTSKTSQELRLALPLGERINWLIGAFYTREHSRYREHVDAADPASGANAGVLLDLYYPTSYREYAAFTNFTFDITDRFDIQIGGRAIREKQEYNVTWAGPYVIRFLAPTSPLIPPSATVKKNAFTYLVTPRFRPTDDLMLYARFASGYRPGGPNSNATTKVIPTYGPDKTQNYEIGAKWAGLDNKLFVDASLYYIDWKDVQVTLRDPVTNVNVTANAGRAKSKGIELAVELRPVRGMKISGWAALNEAELKEDLPPGPAVGFAGDRLPFSSRFSGHASIAQEFPLSPGLTGNIEGSLTYVGDRKGVFTGAAFGVPLPRQDFPEYTQLDFTAGVSGESWEASLFVMNITDKRGLLPSSASNPNVRYPIQPRSFGVTVTKNF